MEFPLLKKLRILPGMKGKITNVPEELSNLYEYLSTNQMLSTEDNGYDFILAFVRSEEDVKEAASQIYDLKIDGLIWMIYPKKSAVKASKISRDSGWSALQELGYQGIAMVSVDETWSAFRFRSSSLSKSSRR